MADQELESIRKELQAREPIFHRREFGASRAELERMTAPDFWEIGASGKTYDRAFVIETVLARYKTPEPDDWSCSDFAIRRLAPDLFQLNYVLAQPGRTTRRTTLWRRVDGDWQIVFHQGTVMS